MQNISQNEKKIKKRINKFKINQIQNSKFKIDKWTPEKNSKSKIQN